MAFGLRDRRVLGVAGHRVIAFDFDAFVIVNLNKGALPVSEPGLDGIDCSRNVRGIVELYGDTGGDRRDRHPLVHLRHSRR